MPTPHTTQSNFRVYRDKPSSFPQTKAEANAKTRAVTTRRLVEVSSAADKENLHPVTGLPPPMLTSGSKKRKTDVLTTKLIRIKEVPSSPKKRRVSTSSSSTSTASDTNGHRQRGSNAKRSTSRKFIRPRRTVNLPRVDEVVEEDRVMQAATSLASNSADARCYELTVTPLADISEAYETSSDEESVKDGASKNYRSEFQTAGHSSLSPPGTPRSERTPGSTVASASAPTVTLATPERRKIYSAFTFTSPSSASKHAASKTSSKHPFLDVIVDSLTARC